MANDSFVHLHVHSEYSMLDGAARVSRLMEAAVEQGMPAIAVTDHGNNFGAYDFWKQATAAGIKPIIGTEAYVTPGTPRSDKTRVRWGNGGEDDVSGSGAYTHMTLLAENTEGMHNLFRLSSLASIEGYYFKPRMDRELLSTLRARASSPRPAASSGEVQTRLRLGQYDEARKAAGGVPRHLRQGELLRRDHGPRHRHRAPRDAATCSGSRKSSTCRSWPPTTCTTRTRTTRARTRRCSACSPARPSTTRTASSSTPTSSTSSRPRRCAQLFRDHPEACDNTLLIAERCEVEFEQARTHAALPGARGRDRGDLVRQGGRDRAAAALPRRPSRRAPRAGRLRDRRHHADGLPRLLPRRRRLHQLGEEQRHPRRARAAARAPARWPRTRWASPSSTRSQHGLIFERFLNPERVSMPDFDVDFDDRRRGEVIRYVTEKYGDERVAQIVTYGTIKAKQALKDSRARARLAVSVGEKLTKAMPPAVMGKDMPLGDIFDQGSERYKEAADFRADRRDRPRGGQGLRHRARHREPQAAVGRARRRRDHVDRAADRHPPDHEARAGRPDRHAVRLAAARVARPASRWTSSGCATSRSSTTRSTTSSRTAARRSCSKTSTSTPTSDLRPARARRHARRVPARRRPDARPAAADEADNFEDISAVIALYRPGPMGMNSHTNYALRKNGLQQIDAIHPELAEPLREILDTTYGLIVYQEQVMAVAQKVAGFTLGQADILRRAMGKKKKSELDKQFADFEAGMQANGYCKQAVKTLWDILMPFADYAFNKAHCAGYGVLSYWTAYLKAHYPAEYMAALLTSVGDSKDKLGIYLNECRRMGIKVLAARRQRVDRATSPPCRCEGEATSASASARCATSAPTSSTAIRAAREEKGRFDVVPRLPAQGADPGREQAHGRVADQGGRVRLARRDPPRAHGDPRGRRRGAPSASSATRPTARSASTSTACGTSRRRVDAGARPAGVGQARQARLRARDARPLRLRPPARRPRARSSPSTRRIVDRRPARRRGRPTTASTVTIAGLVTSVQHRTARNSGNQYGIIRSRTSAARSPSCSSARPTRSSRRRSSNDSIVVVQGRVSVRDDGMNLHAVQHVLARHRRRASAPARS